MIGEVIGNYKIVKKLDEGAMGEVYLGQHAIEPDLVVAFKFLLAKCGGDVRLRFFEEARMTRRIRHAGIVRIDDLGTHGGRDYLRMEFLDGKTLGALVDNGPLSTATVCELGRQLASVLAAAHAEGIIHRDLKPSNVFLVTDYAQRHGRQVKIIDFGIAKQLFAASRHAPTPHGANPIGTPLYMSPEQIRRADVDKRSDIYALGCMLFELLCGRPPFEAETLDRLLGRHLQDSAPRASTLIHETPASLDALFDRMLAKDREHRPQTMKDVEFELSAILGSNAVAFESSADARTVPPITSPAASPRAPTIRPGSQGSEFARTPQLVGRGEGDRGSVSVGGAWSPSQRRVQWLPATIGVICFVAAGAVVAIAKLSQRRALEGRGERVVLDARQPVDTRVPSLRDRVIADNPFTRVDGLSHDVQQRLVSREAYGWFLSSLDPNTAARHTPLRDWNFSRSDAPTVWISFEQAQGFCSSIDAELPTSEDWSRFSIDGAISTGPIGEWTSSISTAGYVVVRRPGDHADAPLLKLRQTKAAPGASAAQIADDQIGFRCVSAKGGGR